MTTKQELLDKIEELKAKVNELEEKERLPESWDSLYLIEGYYINDNSCFKYDVSGYSSPSNINIFATKEQAEASLAFAQLTQLLKAYNGDWKPKENHYRYSIYVTEDLELDYSGGHWNRFLQFKTQEKALHFIEHHKDLIIQLHKVIPFK